MAWVGEEGIPGLHAYLEDWDWNKTTVFGDAWIGQGRYEDFTLCDLKSMCACHYTDSDLGDLEQYTQ